MCYDFEVAIHNQQISNICQFTNYFKNADETSYEIISGNITEPFGHVEYDKEIYMFYNVLIENPQNKPDKLKAIRKVQLLPRKVTKNTYVT